MNLPNKLTIMRCILTPFVVLFMIPIATLNTSNPWNIFIGKYGMVIALILFAIASITDHLDGAIARKYGLITNLGKFLDPIADKILVLAVLIALVALGVVHTLAPIIILFREFAITGVRLLAIEKGKVIAASNLGKLKTVSQIIALIILMLYKITEALYPAFSLPLYVIGQTALWISVVLTLLSGYDYIRKSKDLFLD